MPTHATREEIRARFDRDVERFSKLETGQTTTIDAAYVLDLISECAVATVSGAARLVDLGCGAGNFSLKLAAALPLTSITLVDLSRPMLDRATARLADATPATVTTLQTDLLDLKLPPASADIVVAAAVLHHLREDADWLNVFRAIWESLAPGGVFFIWDLIDHDWPGIRQVMAHRYSHYLEGLGGPEFRAKVNTYVAYEDTPRSVPFQMQTLTNAGFSAVEVLHKHISFAALAARK
ncbi:MAG: class I SAM-dependent methyltransferase [Acidobacteria bacterium]|nr:class I SAM-dependent methyltransferase [Acidobacteriota bacterium]